MSDESSMPKIGNIKEILANSLCTLAETKPVNDITVLDIVNNCGLTAPTFYNHFRNKSDLIIWYYTEQWSSRLEKTGKEGYEWRDALHDGFRIWAENRKVILNLLEYTDGEEAIVEHLHDINVELTSSEIKKKLSEGQTLPPDTDELLKFYCYGTFGYAYNTLKKDDFDPDRVADICEYGLPYILKMFLYG